MPARLTVLLSAACVGLTLVTLAPSPARADSSIASIAGDGIVRVKSAYSIAETIERLKNDIASKGIMFFQAINQTQLAADAGIELRPSTLLVFGNPALGSHFITARAEAGLDWPVRLLVTQDSDGQVWAVYTDFAWIADRHGITNRQAEFAMASKVIASITASVAAD